jgi:hypothetical protein
MNTATQTIRIVIDIPPRADGAPPVPVVTATRATVVLDDEGNVVGTLKGSEDTRVLANVTDLPAFGAVHSALASAVDLAFNPPPPPAPEPDPTPEAFVGDQP